MKKLYMVRHAKSSWGDFSTPDFERPLNDRGKKDAPEMAVRLKERKIKPAVFICSPAKRTKSTCKTFCKAYGISKNDVIFLEELYHAAPDTFNKVVAGISDTFDSAIIFSHNPGITDFVNTLVPGVSIDNMPTCAIFGVAAETSSWESFFAARRNFLFFDFPKNKPE